MLLRLRWLERQVSTYLEATTFLVFLQSSPSDATIEGHSNNSLGRKGMLKARYPVSVSRDVSQERELKMFRLCHEVLDRNLYKIIRGHGIGMQWFEKFDQGRCDAIKQRVVGIHSRSLTVSLREATSSSHHCHWPNSLTTSTTESYPCSESSKRPNCVTNTSIQGGSSQRSALCKEGETVTGSKTASTLSKSVKALSKCRMPTLIRTAKT